MTRKAATVDHGAPSKAAVAMTWAVVLISLGSVLFGLVRYGFSLQVHERFWSDIFERLHGPMTFRFYLQPTMGLIAALHDGVKDVREGHKAFFWTALWDRSQEPGRLREGLLATSRIALLGFGMDTVYQLKALDRFYPAEAVLMVLVLAILPYFIFRWAIERIARWQLARRS